MALAELLEERHPGIVIGVQCHTITLLNERRMPAKARQSYVDECGHLRYRRCPSKYYAWSEDDCTMICVECLTPKRAE